jgi:hypothetical protein
MPLHSGDSACAATFLVAFCSIIAEPVAAQAPTIAIGTPEQQIIYLNGAAAGLAIANSSLAAESQLYCPPWDYILNAQEMRDLAGLQLIGPHEPLTFVIAAITSLREKFPCL